MKSWNVLNKFICIKYVAHVQLKIGFIPIEVFMLIENFDALAECTNSVHVYNV